jgi:hypothetical protein
MRSSHTPPPADLDLLDIMVLVSQVSLDLLHPRALPKVDADRVFFVSRVQHDDNVRAVFVQVCGAVQVVVVFAVADADAVGVGADEARVVRERPQAFGGFVFAVLDQDELFVVVVVCGAVLDDEPPVCGRVGLVGVCLTDSMIATSLLEGRRTNSSHLHCQWSRLCAR